MKVGILTQPLGHNYGGILQNYALQQVLRRIGHEPVTIDLQPREPSWSHFKSCIKALGPVPRRDYSRPVPSEDFIRKHLAMTRPVSRCTASLVEEYGIEALLVGSDQVWRPKYNAGVLYDMFLSFARGIDCPKASYAASFGLSSMSEYGFYDIFRCRRLLRLFDAVSVREHSAVELCRKYFSREATLVLDPTMLLDKADYENLCRDIPEVKSPFLAFYCLDPTEDKIRRARELADDNSLELVQFTSGKNLVLTPDRWLSMFRDSSIVVTDSYHGTIFANRFSTPVAIMPSDGRGQDRIVTLKSLLDNPSELESLRQASVDYLDGWLKNR